MSIGVYNPNASSDVASPAVRSSVLTFCSVARVFLSGVTYVPFARVYGSAAVSGDGVSSAMLNPFITSSLAAVFSAGAAVGAAVGFDGVRVTDGVTVSTDFDTPADDDVLLAPDAVFAGFGVLAGVYTGAVKDGIAAISAFGAELSAGACEAAGVFIAAGVCALGAELPSETIFSSVITPSPVFCPDIRETRLLPFTPITAAKSIQAATEPYFFQPKAKLLLLRASRRI